MENLDLQNILEGSGYGGGREHATQYIRAAHPQFGDDGRIYLVIVFSLVLYRGLRLGVRDRTARVVSPP